jgi:uncharacterized SAM-binding protein YcdF (DUF218 family)
LLAGAVVALTPFATRGLPLHALVRRDALPASLPLDAVIVLSGGITPDSLLEPEAADRLLAGLALMRDGAATTLVVSRPRRSGDGAVADPDQQRLRALVARSFPMLFVDSVHSTRDEAVNAWRLLARPANPAPRVAVVTSPLHTSRACAAFERVGFAVTCIAAPSRAYSVDHATSAEERFALFRRWLYERAAWVEYRAKDWVRPGA